MRVVTGRALSKETLPSVLKNPVSLLPVPLLQLMSSVFSGTQRHTMLKSAFGCSHPKHHSSRGAGVSACSQDSSAPQSNPQKGIRAHGFASSTSSHRGISRSSTDFLKLHHLETFICIILPLVPHQSPEPPSIPPSLGWTGSAGARTPRACGAGYGL